FQDPVLKTVLITGTRTTRFDSRYNGGNQVLTIDLGGDDVYLNNQGSGVAFSGLEDVPLFGGSIRIGLGSTLPRVPTVNNAPPVVALALDLGGNDQYEPVKRSFLGDATSQGAAALGVGLLVDVAGDDRYRAGVDDFGNSSSQGSGVLGVGILADLNGNDTYETAGGAAQGNARLLGIGLLLDTAPQGSPATDDRYLAKERAQGFAFGLEARLGINEPTGHFRHRIPLTPAMGILVDAVGNDRYEGGNLMQGASRGGTALLVDGAGADRYLATDYSQGATFEGNLSLLSPHDVTGALIDLGPGADHFSAQSYGMGANQGLLMNLGEDADLYDASGNRTQGYAGGILVDLGGNDQYFARGVTDDDHRTGDLYFSDAANQPNHHQANPNERFTYAQGSSGPLRSTDGYAVGILMDLGGNDRYVSAGGRSQGWNDSYVTAAAAGNSNSVNVRVPAAPAGLLIDRDGNDRYEAGPSLDPVLGRRGERQGTDSQAYVIDLAGDDVYTNPRRVNDRGFDFSARNSDERRDGLDAQRWDVYADYVEGTLGSNPRNATETPLTDSDGDAFPNWMERQGGTYGELLRLAGGLFGSQRTLAFLLDPTNPNDPGQNPSRVVVSIDCRRSTYTATQTIILDLCDMDGRLQDVDACDPAAGGRGDFYVDNATLSALIVDLGGNDCFRGGDYALSRGLVVNVFGNDAYRGGRASLNGILDYNGLDRYTSTGSRSQSGIVDLAVSDYDRFTARDDAQASFPRLMGNFSGPGTVNGTAYLLNFGHHPHGDIYRAGNMSQAAVNGTVPAGSTAVTASNLALLVNMNGAVSFEARDFSQAAVNAGLGATALLLTGPGSDALPANPGTDYRNLAREVGDTYTTGGALPHSLYVAGLSSQASVGAVGTGPSNSAREAAASLALLYDAAGDDTYRASAYSMASVGRTASPAVVDNVVSSSIALLVDAGGRDRYVSLPGTWMAPKDLRGEGFSTVKAEGLTPVTFRGRSLGYAASGNPASASPTQPTPGLGGSRPAVNLAAVLDGADSKACLTVHCEDDLFFAFEHSLAASRGQRAIAAVINVLGDDVYAAGQGSFANTTAFATALFVDGDGQDRYYLGGTTPLRVSDVVLLASAVAAVPVRGVDNLTAYVADNTTRFVTDSVLNEYVLGEAIPYVSDVVEALDVQVPALEDILNDDGLTEPVWQSVLDVFADNPFGLKTTGIVCSEQVSVQQRVRERVSANSQTRGSEYFTPDTRARVCYDTSRFPERVDYWVYAYNSTPNGNDPANDSVANGSFTIVPDGGVFLNLTVDARNSQEFDRYGRDQCSVKGVAAYRNNACYNGYPGVPRNAVVGNAPIPWWSTADKAYNDVTGAARHNESRLVPLCVPVGEICVLTTE
ncbi:MAG TPA: hypothetical protein VNZ52_11375, partial [Candidatus Thermoplasmatota archaeon]|nr:hypothetical protein [Candidatus Thermoplasmatota archaeon]